MQTHSEPGRVAFLPESEEETEILMEVQNGALDTEDLLAWTTCDGADYESLDADIEDGVLVLTSRPSSTWGLSTILSIIEDLVLWFLVGAGAAAIFRAIRR